MNDECPFFLKVRFVHNFEHLNFFKEKIIQAEMGFKDDFTFYYTLSLSPYGRLMSTSRLLASYVIGHGGEPSSNQLRGDLWPADHFPQPLS
ncbi:hypothetical protein C0J52_07957 [Blattella germanica]|nr:hypothetical protein C0J52_07957 [Blattella germanica]